MCYYYRAIAFLFTITGDLIDPQYYESDSHFCLPLRCDDKNIKYKWVCSRDPLPSKQKWYLPDASDVEEAVGTPKRKRKFHWKEV